MGLRSSSYWLSNFLVDFLMFELNVGLIALLLLANPRPGLNDVKIVEVCLLIACFGIATILFAYCWSFSF